MDVGWISPMTKILQSETSPMGYSLSDEVMSWVASVLCIAGSVGVLIFSYLADKIGRKWAVAVLVIPQAVVFYNKCCDLTYVFFSNDFVCNIQCFI